MISALVVSVALAVAAYLSRSKALAGSATWRATVTPLGSIMGSGFLVSAPLLGGSVGVYAVFCMAGLLLLAYGVGAAIRFNIVHFEPIENDRGPTQSIALLSRFVLAGAYFVSISYYLQLLSAFVLNIVGSDDARLANVATTLLLSIIGGIGIVRGLTELVKVERYAVALNLGMIVALLIALGVYNARIAFGGTWSLPDVPSEIDFGGVRVLLGLLIVVQGFEASRYLGEAFDASTRVRTMKVAQSVSSVIYLVFLSLVTVLFHGGLGSDVTAIIQMTAPVAVVLPMLLTIAAVGSQFSAAVADTEGAGGLIEDLGGGRIDARHAYALILAVTIALTWQSNVNEIIAYASRAFALFYALQCAVAFAVARESPGIDRRAARSAVFAALTLVTLAVFVLGVPAE